MHENNLTTNEDKNLLSAIGTSGVSSGFEELTPSAFTTPFAKIIEALSPECNEDNPGYVPGARPGFMLWPDGRLTKESLVIFLKVEQHIVRWKPNRGGFIDSFIMADPGWKKLVDREDGFKKFDAQGNEFVETMVYYMVNMDAPSNDTVVHLNNRIAVLNLSNARLKYARKINQALQNYNIEGQNATWLGVWKIKTSQVNNDKGAFYVVGSPKLSRNITVDELNNLVIPGQELCKAFKLIINPESEINIEERF